MKRKIYNRLLEWKKRQNGATAVLIEGARRIGKSYVVAEFASNEYDSYLLIDFNKADKVVWTWFDTLLEDLDTLLMNLQIHYGKRLTPGKSVIVFDEVQLCPRARAAIKYLVADGRFHYIETGSLVSIKKNVRDIVIPSEEESIPMYPMDFEEFLWAVGNEMLMPYIVQCFEKRKPMGAFHRKAMELFRTYMIVGGMPQAVQAFVEHKDFDKVDSIKRGILQVYTNDISKYAAGLEHKVKSIFEQIPAQLQKHEKKFRLSALETGATYRDYDDSFFWLADAGIVNICYNCTAPNVGLRLNMERNTLKCYMGDTGLLVSHAFDENGKVPVELYQKMLLNKLEVNEGMLVENIVAQMLAANGRKLYFYSNSSRDDASDRMEIDFLVAKSKLTSRHNITPIEVKSSQRYTLSSLRKCVEKFGEYLATPVVLHGADLKEENGMLFLPLYMTPLL
ncbi:MAG: ATP-binding protein [Paludibacteraceae bacterium]|nr:ATP-binding protein [Paludibacteraceae bacterium]